MKVTITKIESRRTALTSEGTPPFMYEIFYKTETGLTGSIEMTHSEFSPENARKKLELEIVPKAEMIGKTLEFK